MNAISEPQAKPEHDPITTRTAKDLLIYDGECRFCRSQIALLRRLDLGHRLEFISLHDARVPTIAPDLTFDQMMDQMWLITPDGKRYGGADAVRYLSRKLIPLFPLAPFMHIPFSLPLWRWMYKIVARYRYKIAGKTCEGGTCQLHFGDKKPKEK